MSMLSNADILKAIESGQLKVDPYYPKSVKSAGLTMHLGEVLLRPKEGIDVDVKKGIVPEYEKFIITNNSPYILKPGEFILGHTFEKITVGDKIGFLIEGRSTLARVGLTIVQTAMLVYPGHRERAVTLELANNGHNNILLYPKMKIARVVLFELKSASTIEYDSYGKYRDQEVVGPPIFKDEFLKEE